MTRKWWQSGWAYALTAVTSLVAVIVSACALVQARDAARSDRADRAEQRLTDVILRAEDHLDEAPQLVDDVAKARRQLNVGRDLEVGERANVFDGARSELGRECEAHGFTCELTSAG